MTRVCLECGTPKIPLKEMCLACQRETISHEGETRAKLCYRCRWSPNGRTCHWTEGHQSNQSSGVNLFGNRRIDDVIERTTIYAYKCPDFKAQFNNPGPSPNPLSPQERQWIRLFHDAAKSFWLRPARWNHVGEENKEDFWSPPESKGIAKTAAVGLGLLGALVLSVRSSK